MITKDAMESILALLMVDTPGHQEPDFREPMDLEFWSRDHGPLIALSTNRKIIDDLYRHLQTKIRLAEKG